MKIIIPSLIVLFLNSCTRISATLPEKTESTTVVQPKKVSVSKEVYINSIAYFPETQEFYVDLQLKNPDTFDWETVTQMTDSVIYRDDEMTRSRLPISVARQHFNLDLLNILEIFSPLHERIAGVKLSRVEYYETNIESYFIAVFKPAKTLKIKSDIFYCLSPSNELKRAVSSKYIADTLLTARLKKELSIRSGYQFASKHVEVKETGSLYSVLSFQEQPRNVSYLTELKGNKINLLCKQTEEYAFWDILPIPLYQNDKPILLVTMAVPDTDATLAYTPFVFNGKKYVPFYNNRVKLVK
ncbi:hypothetical protein GZH53_05660 [Flavihumibacter sp. R14]|nr:hypothetical protein [Flavihumibacter soli]